MFTGKTALVTHSTSGCGLGIARQLAARGANIVLGGAGEQAQVEALRRDLARQYGVHVRYDGADYSDPAQSEDAIDMVLQEFGCVDILVNNVEFDGQEFSERFSLAEWERVVGHGLSAPFLGIRQVLPAMEIKGWGRIVNVIAAQAPLKSRFQGVYALACQGLAGLTQSLALEVAAQGITVNAVCPGQVGIAPLQDRLPDAETLKGLSVTPDQVGALVGFLASEDAGAINGVVIPMDGGWRMPQP